MNVKYDLSTDSHNFYHRAIWPSAGLADGDEGPHLEICPRETGNKHLNDCNNIMLCSWNCAVENL